MLVGATSLPAKPYEFKADHPFIYLIRELPRDDDVRELAEGILGELSKPHDFGGEELAVSASVGASESPMARRRAVLTSTPA